MADLNYIDRDLEVKIVGQDSVGNTVNYVSADANGNLAVKDYSDGPVVPGAAAAASALIGGQFNTALPTLTNTQQSAIQIDASGRVIIAPTTQGALAEDHNYGTVGATTLRTASQIGNATGAAAFGAGTTGAQVLRVVLPTDQTAIPSAQSGTWTVQPGNTANTTPWLVTVSTALPAGANNIGSVNQGTSPWIVKDQSDGPVTPGAAASFSMLTGGQYNSTQPSLTNTQQAALQLDPLGNLRVTQPNRLVSGTLGALNATITLSSTNGFSSGGLELNGTFSGTVQVQGTVGGTQFSNIGLFNVEAGYNTALIFTGATTQNIYQLLGIGSYTSIRVTVTAYTSGSFAATLSLSSGIDIINAVSAYAPNFNVAAVGNVASGTADSGNGVKVSGVYNSSAPTFVTGQRADLQTDSSGNLKITGTVVANNASVSQVNTTTPSFATYVGGLASTSPPTWGAGDLAPLSIVNVGGYLRTTDFAGGPVTPGTAAGSSLLTGGQFNTSLPTLTNTQQSAIQLDSSGRVIIRPLTSADVVSAAQSGTWTTGRTWTLASGTDSVSAVQSGAWTVQPGNTPNTTPWLVTDSSDGPVAAGTAAAKSSLSGLVFNTALPTLTNTQQAALQGDSSARLIIAPLTNTSVVKAQLQDNAGTAITVGQKAMASSVPVVIASDQSAVPISAVSLPLPTGAATAANQATEITSLQSIDNMIGPVGAGTAGTGSALVGGVFNTALPTLTNGQQAAMQFDSSGRLIIDIGTAIPTGANTIGIVNQGTAASLANAWSQKITDGTNGPVAVKPASTAPLATDPALVVSISPNSPTITVTASPLPAAGSKFSFGGITTTSTAQVAVNATAYTEVTTNAAMTIVSSSAADASAGTGARTVTVTYYDNNMTGPQTVTLTMNGTTAVTSPNNNMAYVEKVVVATVGSGGSNAGTLTLKSGATTVGTIPVGQNLTAWAHHYVPQGKTCYISGFSCGSNGTTAGQSGAFVLKASTPTVANTPEVQISDFIQITGAGNTFARLYNSPIQVVGPARVTAYVSPGATSSYTTYAAFDYIDN